MSVRSIPLCPSRRRRRCPMSVRPVVRPVVVGPLSVRPVVSRRRRRRPLSVPSVPSARPVVVVRPLSVRPRPSHRRRSCVRPSLRPSKYYLHDVA